MFDNAIPVLKKIQETHEAYLVGGCVRDHILNLPIKDIDIATNMKPNEIVNLFHNSRIVGQSFGVVNLKFEDSYFEIATFRKDGKYIDNRRPSEISFGTLEDDAARRDFTINALFHDPIKNITLDPTNMGMNDIKEKTIRAIGDSYERLEEDSLRILRAIRFACKLDFEIEYHTFRALCILAPRLKNIANERIRDEITNILIHPNASKGMQILMESGIIKQILPELLAQKHIRHGWIHHPEGSVIRNKQTGVVENWDPNNPDHINYRNTHEMVKAGSVWDHTLRVLDLVKDRNKHTMWAALLHDIGKPVVVNDDSGQITFHSHDHVGSKMATKILNRMKMSKEDVTLISSVVKDHMKFMEIKKAKKSTFRNFVSTPHFEIGMVVHKADGQASGGKGSNVEWIRNKIEKYGEEPVLPDPVLTGRDLINLGINPGPELGKLKNSIFQMQLDGLINTKEQAIREVKKIFLKKGLIL